MAHRIGRLCLDVSHVHEDSIQNAGIRKDADSDTGLCNGSVHAAEYPLCRWTDIQLGLQ